MTTDKSSERNSIDAKSSASCRRWDQLEKGDESENKQKQNYG